MSVGGRGTALAFGCTLLCCACGEDFAPQPEGPSPNEWSRSFGDPMSQHAQAVAVDAYGNIYVAGSFQGTMEVGINVLTAESGEDIFIVKYDTDGGVVWGRRYGHDGDQHATAVALDPAGNLLVTGDFGGTLDFGGAPLTAAGTTDVFLVKLSPEGDHLATQSLSGAGSERAWGVAVGADGNVVVGGDFDVDMGGSMIAEGERDIFAMKLSADLAPLWSKHFGQIFEDVLLGIDVSVTNEIALTGYSRSPLDFGGDVLPPSGAEANEDAFIAVLDEEGEHIWSRRLGDITAQRGYDVRFTVDGELLVMGSFGGTIDFGGIEHRSSSSYDAFVVKYDQGGEPLWVRSYGVSGDQQGYRVAVDRDGNVFIAGDYRDIVGFGGEQWESAGEWDVFLAKVDGAGNHLSSHGFGDPLNQHVADLAVDTAGHPVLVGSYFGVIDFGFGYIHESAGQDDPFVAKCPP
ncbi:MAG TPA: hypothetical protein VFB62_24205 [Polyangiaceae bacterium]|nr:hypothetical protein [Polyangiaceae bacterium]